MKKDGVQSPIDALARTLTQQKYLVPPPGGKPAQIQTTRVTIPLIKPVNNWSCMSGLHLHWYPLNLPARSGDDCRCMFRWVTLSNW